MAARKRALDSSLTVSCLILSLTSVIETSPTASLPQVALLTLTFFSFLALDVLAALLLAASDADEVEGAVVSAANKENEK